MADELETAVAPADNDQASALVSTLEKLGESAAAMQKSLAEQNDKIEKLSATAAPPWMSGAPAVTVGERAGASRPFSYSRLALGLAKMNANDESWREQSKLEVEFCRQLGARSGIVGARFAVPIGSEFLTEESGFSDLRKEWSDMGGNLNGFDPDEMKWMADQLGLQKSMSFRTHTAGGTLVDFPERGELIDLLRNTSIFGQIPGITEVPMPQQGSISYPRVTSGVTISSYAESEAVSDSTIGTDDVTLELKKYAGMVKLPEEFLKFATSVASDAFVRGEMSQDATRQIDADIVDGGGGKRIHGLINYTGITTHSAGTPGTNGDTLEPGDVEYLLAKMADANAPVDRGVFIAMRNRLWTGLQFREDTNGRPKFNASAQSFGGGRPQKQLSGESVYLSNNIPGTRAKGTGTDLTLVLAGVPSELYLGRGGIMEIMMTNSDGDDFGKGKYTLRGVHYVDCVPKHEVSFGMIDQLLQS